MIYPTAKVSEEVNVKMPAKNTMGLLTSKPTLSAAMHSVTDGQTDGRTEDADDIKMMPIADQCVAQYDGLKCKKTVDSTQKMLIHFHNFNQTYTTTSG